MLLVILFLTCAAYHHQGTIQTNQVLNLTLNFTDQAPSIKIKFTLPIARQNQYYIACFVSVSDILLSTVNLLQVELTTQANISFDIHSIESNSDTQLVEFTYNPLIYLSCQSGQSIQIDYQLTYLEEYLNPFCINNCKGYDNINNGVNSRCINNYCDCQLDRLGQFCQLSSSYVLDNNWVKVSLDSYKWKYFYYYISNTDIEIHSNLNYDDNTIFYSLSLRQSPWQNIPNQNQSYLLKNCSQLSDILYWMVNEESSSNILYIGIFNSNSYQVKLNLSIVSLSSDDYDQAERNKLILIIIGSIVGFLLLCSFCLSILKNYRQQQNTENRENINQNQELQLNPQKSPTGFSKQFIKEYFGPFIHQQVIEYYPGLLQFEDCVICLESLKDSADLQLRYCSITPCFHIFHQYCLSSWLSKQRNCPFCRRDFRRVQIQNSYPWIELSKENNKIVQGQTTQYLQGLKNTQITDQSQDFQLNESQQELVNGRNRKTVDA